MYWRDSVDDDGDAVGEGGDGAGAGVATVDGVVTLADAGCDAPTHYLCHYRPYVAQAKLHSSALLCPVRRMIVGRRGAANAGESDAVMVGPNVNATIATTVGVGDAAIAHL